MSSDLLSVLGWYDGTPRSFSSFMSPTMTVGVLLKHLDSRITISAMKFSAEQLTFRDIHCSLHVLTIVCATWRRDLSAVEYDVENIDNSPPASVIRATVYAACCAAVIFMHVANATSLGHPIML